jgi:hypothetical protein
MDKVIIEVLATNDDFVYDFSQDEDWEEMEEYADWR